MIHSSLTVFFVQNKILDNFFFIFVESFASNKTVKYDILKQENKNQFQTIRKKSKISVL